MTTALALATIRTGFTLIHAASALRALRGRLARRSTPTHRIPAMAALALVMGGASAAPADAPAVGWHPATSQRPMAVAGIDPNTFIPGHPASPMNRGGYAGFEHPAVQVARAAADAGIDANTFLVQPPVAVTWLDVPRQDDTLRYAQAAGARMAAAR